jgi:catechol 2,3-dioxygenase
MSGSDAPVRDPEELEAADTPASGAIAPSARPGTVHLTVSDLQRSLEFYTRSIGLSVFVTAAEEPPGERSATLGSGATPLLVLVEEPDARPAPRSTGLYHFALLVPRRVDLAGWLAHAASQRVVLAGVADHFVSEALYLSDPDGHGIEIYWDRPREAWEGRVAQRMTTLPLDVENLLAELPDAKRAGFEGLPRDTAMGHVHLKVASIPEAVTFYRDVLGFALMAALGSQAAFLSAGGYHHHIGANTWESRGASPPPRGAAALRRATILLPDQSARERVLVRLSSAEYEPEELEEGSLVRDPSGNPILLSTEHIGVRSS